MWLSDNPDNTEDILNKVIHVSRSVPCRIAIIFIVSVARDIFVYNSNYCPLVSCSLVERTEKKMGN